MEAPRFRRVIGATARSTCMTHQWSQTIPHLAILRQTRRAGDEYMLSLTVTGWQRAIVELELLATTTRWLNRPPRVLPPPSSMSKATSTGTLTISRVRGTAIRAGSFIPSQHGALTTVSTRSAQATRIVQFRRPLGRLSRSLPQSRVAQPRTVTTGALATGPPG